MFTLYWGGRHTCRRRQRSRIMQNRYRCTSGGMGNRNSPYRGGAKDTCMGRYGTRREAGSHRTLWKRIGLMYPGCVNKHCSTHQILCYKCDPFLAKERQGQAH